jgi:hypothetical protein
MARWACASLTRTQLMSTTSFSKQADPINKPSIHSPMYHSCKTHPSINTTKRASTKPDMISDGLGMLVNDVASHFKQLPSWEAFTRFSRNTCNIAPGVASLHITSTPFSTNIRSEEYQSSSRHNHGPLIESKQLSTVAAITWPIWRFLSCTESSRL